MCLFKIGGGFLLALWWFWFISHGGTWNPITQSYTSDEELIRLVCEQGAKKGEYYAFCVGE